MKNHYDDIKIKSVKTLRMTVMHNSTLLNEIKLIELKLQALKTQVKSKKPKVKTHTSATLYGLLKESQDITPEDIDAVKVKLKESV